MIIRHRRGASFVTQAAIYLAALFLSLNLLATQMASGADVVAHNHSGAPGNGRKFTHEEELFPRHPLHDQLYTIMEEKRGDSRSRDEYLHYLQQRRDRRPGLENPHYLPSGERVAGEGVEGAHTAGITWATEYLDEPRFFDGLSSRAIAIDADNHPHIAYGGDHLYYAYHDGSSWHYETVDPSYYVGWNASIALDASGHVHISYEDHYNFDLKYATNASGSWVATTVVSYGWVGFNSSIAVDASGHVHISYCDEVNYEIRYATNASGAWLTTTVATNAYFDSSIAVDATGHAHISYTHQGLCYATNVSGEWVTITVDSDLHTGSYNSIAVDASNHVHISYLNGGIIPNLKYATNISGSWVTATVDSDEGTGGFSSLSLDALGYAHISYHDHGNTSLKYATNASGAWVATTVDNSGGDVGACSSLALDKDGKVHISYLLYIDHWNAALKYATNASGAWITKVVDHNGKVGFDTSLKLDSKGNVHISYNDELNSDLKYATNKSGRWVAETVATDENIGWNTSLALDKDDKAHISHTYFTYDNSIYDHNLKYTTNASGRWVTTTVDGKGEQGWYSSIKVDASGSVHIAYSDLTLHDLKYAVSIPPPTAVTRPATRVAETSARLNATVNAKRLPTEVWFEWGFHSDKPYYYASPKKTFNGETNEKYNYKAQNLIEKKKYYYRVAAENEDGITYGDEMSFKTGR